MQLEQAEKHGLDVLFFVDPVDEWLVDSFREFEGKKLVDIARGNISFGSETEQKAEKADPVETVFVKAAAGAGGAYVLAGEYGKCYEVKFPKEAKVIAAMQKNRVNAACFAGTTGYGYSDKGREKLGKIFADIFGGEDGAAGAGFVSGTHAITCGLFGALEPGDKLISAIADPYDTLMKVIGDKKSRGTLKNYGIDYEAVPLTADLKPDLEAIEAACRACPSGAVLIQRSRGYSLRPTLSIAEIKKI